MLQLENRWLDFLQSSSNLHRFRHAIGILLQKGESAIRQDKYERYDEVVRPTFHAAYADMLFNLNGRKALHDFLTAPLEKVSEIEGHFLELGCGTGRLLWELLQKGPQRHVLGLDFSYNMLRQAADLFLKGRLVEADARPRGLGKATLQFPQQTRLLLGQADAQKLPLVSAHFSLVVQSFLLDRLDNPIQGIKESLRVLRKGGQLVLISPLNFQRSEQWDMLGTAKKVRQALEKQGATIIREARLPVTDILDARLNSLQWNCLALWAEKK